MFRFFTKFTGKTVLIASFGSGETTLLWVSGARFDGLEFQFVTTRCLSREGCTRMCGR